MQKRRSFLTKLPPELLDLILRSLSDPDTLASVALSCRQLYAAFRSNEKRIIREVLISHIGIEVLPEAALAYHSTPQPFKQKNVYLKDLPIDQQTESRLYIDKYIADLRDNGLSRPVMDSLNFDMNEALDLKEKHFYVVEFTERFIQTCSKTIQVKLGHSFNSLPPSSTEMARISRALYRTEFFSGLFGSVASEGLHNDLKNALMMRFEPWEICQLGCINDFLAHEVIPAFVDTVNHDGVLKYDNFGLGHGYNIDMQTEWIQHILSLGLEKVYTLTTDKRHEERKRVFRDHEELDNYLTPLQNVLDDLHIYGYSKFLKSGSTVLQKPFYDDGDIGAQQIWEHSKLDENEVGIYEEMDWKTRAWGYVLWDSARLQALGILDIPWEQETTSEPSLESAIELLRTVESGYLNDNDAERQYLNAEWSSEAWDLTWLR